MDPGECCGAFLSRIARLAEGQGPCCSYLSSYSEFSENGNIRCDFPDSPRCCFSRLEYCRGSREINFRRIPALPRPGSRFFTGSGNPTCDCRGPGIFGSKYV